MEEFKAELAIRLAGKDKDEILDDQLFGAAANLSEAEFK